jgi:hypothetical protein
MAAAVSRGLRLCCQPLPPGAPRLRRRQPLPTVTKSLAARKRRSAGAPAAAWLRRLLAAATC